MADDRINYAKKIDEILRDLPDFVGDFIYNVGPANNYATKYQYAFDIRDFMRFMVNYTEKCAEKEMSEITLKDMKNIKPLDIDRYLTILKGDEGKGIKNKKGLKETTVKRRRATLSSLFGFLVKNGKIKTNPVLMANTVKVPSKDVIYLTDIEQKRLIKAVESGNGLSKMKAKYHEKYVERDSAIFMLLLDTGLRVSEMLSTDIIDYNLKEGSVIVTRKGGDVETVYYSDECASYLFRYFCSQREKLHLTDALTPAFTTLSGERLGKDAVEDLVKKYMLACIPEKASVISPHKLRSSFAMSFYEASNNNVLLLQKKLHHKSINTTNIYAKASDKDSKDSRNLLSERRQGKKVKVKSKKK